MKLNGRGIGKDHREKIKRRVTDEGKYLLGCGAFGQKTGHGKDQYDQLYQPPGDQNRNDRPHAAGDMIDQTGKQSWFFCCFIHESYPLELKSKQRMWVDTSPEDTGGRPSVSAVRISSRKV